MNQIAKVRKIEGTSVLICYAPPSSEKEKSSRRFWGVKERNFHADNPGNLVLKQGDFVEIYLPPGKTILSAFMVFIFPLILFPLFYFAADLVFPEAGEGIKALAGLGGIAAGFVSTALFSSFRKKRGRDTLPVIVRVVDEKTAIKDGGKKNCGSCGLCG